MTTKSSGTWIGMTVIAVMVFIGLYDCSTATSQIPAAAGKTTTDNARMAALPGPKKDIVIDLGDGVTMELVLIQPGSFTMGDAIEKPMHKVTLSKPFYMGKYEVTQAQWEQIMGNNPGDFKGPKKPVDKVSWIECQEFLAKLNAKLGGAVIGGAFRLPTEAEWEYACRAGTTTKFYTGDNDTDLEKASWYGGNSGTQTNEMRMAMVAGRGRDRFSGHTGAQTHEVGGKAPNTWGLYDMHGNVGEWCQDWDGDYSPDPVTDPTGPASGKARIIRGGSANQYDIADNCRSAKRNQWFPHERGRFWGFRVAKTVNP